MRRPAGNGDRAGSKKKQHRHQDKHQSPRDSHKVLPLQARGNTIRFLTLPQRHHHLFLRRAANAGHLDSGSVERCHEGRTSPVDVPARGWARDGLSAIKRPGSGTHRKGRAPFAVPLP